MKGLAGLIFAGALAGMAMPASANTVTITVTDLRADDGEFRGVVRACMTTVEDVFPRCRRDPASHSTVVPAAETVTIRFDGVEPGKYAIAILHDENGNGKADRVLGMAPKEGFGFSRDAPVRMAPPDWNDAVFEIGRAASRMTIRMRYFL